MDCPDNTDELKLVREGTTQDQRYAAALDPGYAPVDGRTPAHGLVFAQDYSAMLRYFDADNSENGDWTAFFNRDVSARLALAAIEDVDAYRATVKSWFDYLGRRENHAEEERLKECFGFLYGAIATLAQGLDEFKEGLPEEIAQKGALRNLITSHLAPALKRLIACYRAGAPELLPAVPSAMPAALILCRPLVAFGAVLQTGLSKDWSEGKPWAEYVGNGRDNGIHADVQVYGDAQGVFDKISHCINHHVFKSVFEQFLRCFSKTTSDASAALQDTFTKWDSHEPHYALFIAFLRLLEHARGLANGLTRRHLDFYYREVLRLKEKDPEPGHVHLVAELAKQAASREFKRGELYRAGKDSLGIPAFFGNDRAFVANQARVSALKSVYRHPGEPDGTPDRSGANVGRLFASPMANSQDGMGAKLTSVDESWHPFSNKFYEDGGLKNIGMPKADIGFAIASHYLLMAEGDRTITVDFTLKSSVKHEGWKDDVDWADDVACRLTGQKEWIAVAPETVSFTAAKGGKTLTLKISLPGGAPAIAPYARKAHGDALQTTLPVLVVKLLHREGIPYVYPALEDAVVEGISLTVEVNGLRTLCISNDLGPVDASKPYQPFGPIPAQGNSLVIGSREVFQKQLSVLEAGVKWQPPGVPFPQPDVQAPQLTVSLLGNGEWKSWNTLWRDRLDLGLDPLALNSKGIVLMGHEEGVLADNRIVVDAPDFSPDAYFALGARYGFARLELTGDFGHAAYQERLLAFLTAKQAPAPDGKEPPPPPKAPVAPGIAELWLNYTASTTLDLGATSANDETPSARFFHLNPFGFAERHPRLNSGGPVSLLPQFAFRDESGENVSEAELYIGISGLAPPQNISLLFQVADGTANPLCSKPAPHISWNYLKNNEWAPFDLNGVQDESGEWLKSGIVTLSVPADATSDNTVLPAGAVWIRAAVNEASDAVCRLQLVAAQAFRATFIDQSNAPDFSSTPLPPGTISKLDQPDSAVKAISQPFASFGGRGQEEPTAYYTRVSERLRHKDRAIALWDYERLILAAFPQVYKVKCLNHTRYEGNIYRELAPGHVTVVTLPNLKIHNLRDPLKPYTGLDLLQQIEAFLMKRVPNFVKLHVRNPKFEEVSMSFKVRMVTGYDESFYTGQLRKAITRFMSPWAYAESGTPSFGGRIYKSALVNFIEDQPYVDYVTDVQMFRMSADGARAAEYQDEAQGSTAISILVSAPPDKHDIGVITASQEAASMKSCEPET